MDKNLHKHHNMMNIITKSLMKLFLVLLIAQAVFPTLVSAEGSVDFVDYPGYRLMFFAERQQQTKVFANEGEFINFGASHVGITGGFIRVFRPDGTLHSTYNNTGISEGLAIINNDVEELNGPTGGGTSLGSGYVPGVVEVGAGETGAWTVTFEFPIYTNGVFNNLMNDEAWDRNQDQPLNQRCVLSWDVTISQGGAGNNDGTLIDGRVYTNEYQSIVSLNGNLTSPSFYVLTPDGFRYKVDYHDVDPWGFPIFSNNWGIVNGNVQPTYSSWKDADITRSADVSSWVANNTYIYEPQAEDTEDIVNNKIFFNMPNEDLPANTLTTDIYRNNTHTTWLFSSPPTVDVEIQEVQFYANDVSNTGDPIFNAFDPILGAFLSFTSTLNGTTRLDLDLNFDGDFDDEEDVALFKRVEGGVLDSVYWDGLNGLGEQTFAPAQDVQLLYQVSFYGGEMHVMMGDIENDLGGVTFTRVNGNGAPVDTFYYDHRMIGGEASGGVTTGAPQPTTTPYTYSNNFGNRKTLDYWTYIGLTEEQDVFIIDIVDDLNDLVVDSDGDSIRDNDDLDDDNDGIPDALEYCTGAVAFSCLPNGTDPSGDFDEDGVLNFMDANDPDYTNPCIDTDNDGLCDNLPAAFDFDGDGVPNHLDLDSDNDGITDLEEADHDQIDANGDGVIDGESAEFGLNGLYNPLATNPDSFAATANYTPSEVDQDGFPDFLDLDTDNDGILDIKESGHDLLTDADNNGMGDGTFPLTLDTHGLLSGINPDVTGNPIPQPINSDNDTVEDYRDRDSDNDGITDVLEGGNLDADNDGVVGTGMATVDDFGVVVMDGTNSPVIYATSNVPDTDNDGIEDYLDLDSDNDGINDVVEGGNLDADDDGIIGTDSPTVDDFGMAANVGVTSNPLDSDEDGIYDFLDLDSDNDGINDVVEGGNLDEDNDGIIGVGNPTVNENGQATIDGEVTTTSNPLDSDEDGVQDYLDLDSDNDGINDVVEGGNLDADNDGIVGTGTPTVNEDGQTTLNGDVVSTSNPLDSDEDGVQDYLDLDSDNDGINDVVEGGNLDADNDGIVGTGTPTVNEDGQPLGDNGMIASTSDPLDSDEDGIQDYLDLDSDNDGINDVVEGGNLDEDNDGIVGTGTPVVNEDGQTILDGDVVSTSNPLDSDGDGVQDYLDLDSDNDGINDVVEGGNLDADNDGIVGTGTPVVNEDGQTLNPDGTIASTSDPLDSDDDGVEDYLDLDSDNDGINDVVEGGNLDPDNDGIVGTGDPQVNDDGQPIGDDGLTASTSDPLDTDGDGVEDYLDLDSDNDGINDVIEGGADDPDNDGIVGEGDPVVNDDGQPTINGDVVSTSNPTDTDGNGDPDYIDLDSDDDGINDVIEGGADDPDNDGIVGEGDPEVNDDGQPTINGDVVSTSNPTDTDGNGDPDFQDLDSDDDGLIDEDECSGGSPCLDFDEDGIPDFQDIDSDDDGINDDYECPNGVPCPDSDGDGNTDHHDLDSDDDGIQDEDECPNGAPCPDTDNDGDDDFVDVDSDDDGILDEDECPDGAPCPDFDGDGDPDQLDPDCTILVDDALIAGTNTVCEGTDIELTVSNSDTYFNTYPDSDIQFIWSDNNIEFNTGANPVLSIPTNEQSTDQSFTVSVMIDGCMSNVSPALAVDVISIPEAAITPNATTVCQGEEITLSANPGTGLNYEWYLISTDGNILVGSEQNLMISNVANSGTYELQISSDNCTEVSTALVAVEVNPTPTIELTSNTQSFCTNEDIVVTASANNGLVGDVTYTWTGPNGTFMQTVDAGQPFEWTVGAAVAANAGMYQLTLETADGCVSSTEAIMVEIADALATPELSVSSDALCVGNALTLSIENTSYMNVTYEWFYEGTSIVETNDPSFTLPSVSTGNMGMYSVEVSSLNCGSVQSLSVPVEVFTAVEVPMIENPTSLSAACEGTDVLLQVMNVQQEAIYTWFDAEGVLLPNQTNGNNATYTLANVSESDAGLYYVEIEVDNASEDCNTQTSETTMVEIAEPIETTVIAANNNDICENETIILELINNQELVSMNTASFEWHFIDENGANTVVETTSTPILTIENVTTANTGTYYVELTVDGCTSDEFAALTVSVSATPDITAEANLEEVPCNSDAISLVGNQPTVGTGQWLDINGEPVGVDGEVTVDINNLQQGDYQYIWALSNGACVNYSMDTLSYSNTAPLAAYAGDDAELCEDSYMLTAIPALETVVSQWESSSNVVFDDPFDPTTEVSNLQEGENILIWTLSEPGCPDFSVDTIIVTYYPTTDIASAGLDDNPCASDEYQLNATMPEFGFGQWEVNGGAIVGNADQPNAVATNLQEGENMFIWQLSNDNCENYSADTVIISYTPPVDEATLMMDAQTYACFETVTGTLTLEAETPQLATGTWAQTIGPSSATIIDENAATTIVGDLEEGVYVFTWTLSQADCGVLGSQAVMIDISVTPNDQALVMNDEMITCSDTEVMIEADQPQTAEGFWMPITEGLTISDDDNPVTQVSGLQPGENQIAWMLSYDNCENYSTDVLTIFYQEGVNTTEDNFNVVSGMSLSDVNILDNDSYNVDGNWSVSVVDAPQNGQLNVSETGEFTYIANDGFVGADVFTYELCNEDCDDCQEATVTIDVMPDPNATCFVPNIITPNDDGFNDALVIPCTDQFPDNYIIIFNRWGDKVYERDQYQNDWRGEYNDIMLPAGTYFYIFKQDKNANDALQGYISIMR